MNYLKKFRQRPARERHNAVMIGTVLGGVLVISGWAVLIPYELGVKKTADHSNTPSEFRPFSLLKDSVKNSYTQIVGGAGNADILKKRGGVDNSEGLIVVPNPSEDVANAEIHETSAQ